MQQLLDRSDGQGYRAQLIGVELEISGRDGNVAFDIGVDPDDTATPKIGLVSDTDQRESPSAQGMARIGNGDRLIGGER